MDNANPQDGDPTGATVDQELLVLSVVVLVLLVGVEGVAIGWGLNKAAQLASSAQGPERLLTFAKWVAVVLAPIVALNAALGVFFARALSAPLIRIRRAINEVTRGNLEHELVIPPGGLLRDYAEDCRKMLQTLRRLVYRDHQSATEAGALLAECQKLLGEPEADKKKISELINRVRSELSVINHHFTKGRREQA